MDNTLSLNELVFLAVAILAVLWIVKRANNFTNLELWQWFAKSLTPWRYGLIWWIGIVIFVILMVTAMLAAIGR